MRSKRLTSYISKSRQETKAAIRWVVCSSLVASSCHTHEAHPDGHIWLVDWAAPGGKDQTFKSSSLGLSFPIGVVWDRCTSDLETLPDGSGYLLSEWLLPGSGIGAFGCFQSLCLGLLFLRPPVELSSGTQLTAAKRTGPSKTNGQAMAKEVQHLTNERVGLTAKCSGVRELSYLFPSQILLLAEL